MSATVAAHTEPSLAALFNDALGGDDVKPTSTYIKFASAISDHILEASMVSWYRRSAVVGRWRASP